MVAGLARLAAEHPLWALAVWALISAFGLAGILQLRIDTTIGSSLVRNDAKWINYLRSVQRHGGDEFVAVALPRSAPLSASSLRAVTSLTFALEHVPGVRRVDSLATVPLIREGGDGELLIDPALAEGVPESASALERLRGQIKVDLIAPAALVSPDWRVLAANVLLEGGVDRDRGEAVRGIREVAERYDAEISGVPVFREAVSRWTRQELALFIPATVALVGLLLVGLVGIRGAAAALLVSGVGTIGALGCMGWLGATLTVTTMVLPSILLALGCAYTMHVLIGISRVDVSEHPSQAIVAVARPIALSGVTTSAGFFAMVTVKIALIRDLAAFGALGVLVVTAATLTMAPAILSLWGMQGTESPVAKWLSGRAAPMIFRSVVQRRLLVAALWFLLGGVALVGVAQLRVSSDVIRWFPAGTDVRDSYERIRSSLSGITPVNVLVEAAGRRGVADPEIVRLIDRMGTELTARPGVGKVLSIADPLRMVHAVLSGPEATELPGTRGAIEQYLLILEGVPQIDDVIHPDRRSANVLLRLDRNESAEILAVAEWVERWWSANGAADFRVSTTGIMHEFGRSQDEIALGVSRGLSIALVVVWVVLLAAFRDLRTSLTALLPNILPLVVLFGAVGMIGAPLDAATACLGSLALGIAVDDTVHVVLGCQEGRHVAGDWGEAVRHALARVLPALVFTTATIGIGFGVLCLSRYTLIRNLGAMVSSAVVLCLLADLVLLPALLVGKRTSRAK